MFVNNENGTERSLCIEQVYEDIPGGGIVDPDDFKTTTTVMPEGALLGKDSNGIYHIFKTAELYENEANTEVAYKVHKNHEFVVGDFLMAAIDTGSACYAITGITTSNANYDVLTIGTTLGLAMLDGDMLVQGTAEAASAGAGVYKYDPVAIALNSVDLTNDNLGCGLLVRGTVNQSLLPYGVDTKIKAFLPLVRFI